MDKLIIQQKSKHENGVIANNINSAKAQETLALKAYA
jgi:hypothetical protein